jgi:hypothetical protein
MLDNEFFSENNVLLHAASVPEPSDTNRPQEQAMRTPQPFTIYQSTPGQTFPTPLFTVHAYSLEQAREIAAAKVAGETIVLPVSPDGAGR